MKKEQIVITLLKRISELEEKIKVVSDRDKYSYNSNMRELTGLIEINRTLLRNLGYAPKRDSTADHLQ